MTTNTMAYVTNMKTAETTRYNDYGFEHVIKKNGKHYGIKPEGIYLLEGLDDDGVELAAGFTLTKNDFKSSLYKRVPYIFVDSDNDTIITPTADGVTHPDYTSLYGGKRTKLGRGIKGRYWSFKFTNVAGGLMSIRGFEIEPELMTRRIS